MSKKEDLTSILIIILLLSIIIFSPQITDYFKGMTAVTGRDVLSATYDLNITIGNQAPVIQNINISSISPASVSINLDSYVSVSYTFVACDADQQNSVLKAYGNFTGEDSFFDSNITCEATGWTNTTCKEFNCSTNIWYFYKAGSWNSSMNVTDGTSWAHNNVSTVTLGSTTGMVISPSALEWPNLNLDTWNQTSNNDPIIINNTGNYNVTLGSVNITGYDLKGEETLTEYIPSINFTVSPASGGSGCSGGTCIECFNTTSQGVGILNQTSVNIAGSMLARGNHSLQDMKTGQENISFCLVHVPPSTMISAQSYSTENSNQWIIGVT